MRKLAKASISTTSAGSSSNCSPWANESAPDPVFGETPHDMPAKDGSPGLVAPGNDCRPVGGVSGRKLCTEVVPMAPDKAPRKSQAAEEDGLTCPVGVNLRKYTIFTACFKNRLLVTLRENNTPIGTATFTLDQSVELNATKATIYQSIHIKPDLIQPQLGTVTVKVGFTCTPHCTSEAPIPVVYGVWAPGQTYTATTTSMSKWDSFNPSSRYTTSSTCRGKSPPAREARSALIRGLSHRCHVHT